MGEKGPERDGGFTLLELLLVITLIMILAGWLLAGLDKLREGAKKRKAEVEVKAVSEAFEAYFSDREEWPVRTNAVWTNDNLRIIRYLFASNNTMHKAYWEEERSLSNGMKDTWGTYLEFRLDLSQGRGFIRVRSAGPDMRWGTSDDIL